MTMRCTGYCTPNYKNRLTGWIAIAFMGNKYILFLLPKQCNKNRIIRTVSSCYGNLNLDPEKLCLVSLEY